MPSTAEWIEELKTISVLELSERIKALEETFGVSATATVAAPGPGAGEGVRRRYAWRDRPPVSTARHPLAGSKKGRARKRSAR